MTDTIEKARGLLTTRLAEIERESATIRKALVSLDGQPRKRRRRRRKQPESGESASK